MIISSKAILLIFFISFSFSEINFQFYQESKIASGETIKQGITESYIINENIFDLGLGYNQFYLHTQLEYSDPPIYGTTPNDLYGSYFVEYSGTILNLDDYYSKYHNRETSDGLLFANAPPSELLPSSPPWNWFSFSTRSQIASRNA